MVDQLSLSFEVESISVNYFSSYQLQLVMLKY